MIQKYKKVGKIANDYDFFFKNLLICRYKFTNLLYLCICKLQIAKLMSTKITHSGVIESIEDGCVHVRIVQTSACAACKVAGYCNAAEKKEKVVDVYGPTQAYRVGQQVTVTTSGSVAARALLWAFGVPFLVMMAVLIGVLLLTDSEGLAAVSALLSLLPYYLVLWLLRDRMRRQLAFAIE